MLPEQRVTGDPSVSPPDGDPVADARVLERSARPLVDLALAAADEMEERVAPAHLRALQALELVGPCQVSVLATAMSLLPSTVSRLSDRLAAAGLVTREASPTNRRATVLALTTAGRRVLTDLARTRAERLRAVLARMEPQDREALLAGAAAFAAAFTEDGPGEQH